MFGELELRACIYGEKKHSLSFERLTRTSCNSKRLQDSTFYQTNKDKRFCIHFYSFAIMDPTRIYSNIYSKLLPFSNKCIKRTHHQKIVIFIEIRIRINNEY